MSLLNDALEYRRRGWSVIPVGKDKRATQPWKPFQERLATETELAVMFNARNITGLAVVLGPVSGGLYCRDFDKMDGYKAFTHKFPKAASTLPTVITGRGRHVYFATDTECRTTKLGDGELRGRGGYCLLPPSIHPTGVKYRWLIPPPKGHLPALDPCTHGLLHCTESTELTEATELTEDLELEELPELSEDYRSGSEEFASFTRIHSIDEAVRKACPTARNQNHSHLFTLARALLAYRKTMKLPNLTEAMMQESFRKWYTLAKPYLDVQNSRDNYFFEFLDALENARVPLGDQQILMRAFHRAATRIPKIALQFESREVRLLVSLCRELQRHHGEQPFFIADRTVAKLFNHSTHTTAAQWLRGLVRTRILAVVIKGGPETMKATRYRYLHPLDGE